MTLTKRTVKTRTGESLTFSHESNNTIIISDYDINKLDHGIINKPKEETEKKRGGVMELFEVPLVEYISYTGTVFLAIGFDPFEFICSSLEEWYESEPRIITKIEVGLKTVTLTYAEKSAKKRSKTSKKDNLEEG